ncbi:3-oxoadipate enol-lactonase [Trinickia dabaoshanensis]|uniref:3-oxoadipate enol-lactonase n=1 Tax=Trinickia dabaoshanensis TaxID=564714 RepID=A0A2N7VKE6_9BURK|nr:3-oxoadipate enol-lactonase [Trinickia dabaoshanensis]PMS17603.1 3-oxoadipate enol-lactonase [Trinickia dabaoshanensis]
MQHANGIAYTTAGPQDAPAIVLSNSLGTTLDMWSPQLEALTQRFRVVRYDARGHGASTAALDTVTLDTLGRDVLAVLDALNIERAHFCGISMGGLTGQWLGVHAGERIGKLIVANTAARIGSFDGWAQRAALVRAEGMAEVAAGAAGRWFTADFVERHPRSVAQMTDELRATSASGYAACCDALATADLREAIATIAVPTLVIAGEHDPVTTVDDARYIAERVRDSRTVALSASHLSNIEAAEAFNAAVLAFLAE